MAETELVGLVTEGGEPEDEPEPLPATAQSTRRRLQRPVFALACVALLAGLVWVAARGQFSSQVPQSSGATAPSGSTAQRAPNDGPVRERYFFKAVLQLQGEKRASVCPPDASSLECFRLFLLHTPRMNGAAGSGGDGTFFDPGSPEEAAEPAAALCVAVAALVQRGSAVAEWPLLRDGKTKPVRFRDILACTISQPASPPPSLSSIDAHVIGELLAARFGLVPGLLGILLFKWHYNVAPMVHAFLWGHVERLLSAQWEKDETWECDPGAVSEILNTEFLHADALPPIKSVYTLLNFAHGVGHGFGGALAALAQRPGYRDDDERLAVAAHCLMEACGLLLTPELGPAMRRRYGDGAEEDNLRPEFWRTNVQSGLIHQLSRTQGITARGAFWEAWAAKSVGSSLVTMAFVGMAHTMLTGGPGGDLRRCIADGVDAEACAFEQGLVEAVATRTRPVSLPSSALVLHEEDSQQHMIPAPLRGLYLVGAHTYFFWSHVLDSGEAKCCFDAPNAADFARLYRGHCAVAFGEGRHSWAEHLCLASGMVAVYGNLTETLALGRSTHTPAR